MKKRTGSLVTLFLLAFVFVVGCSKNEGSGSQSSVTCESSAALSINAPVTMTPMNIGKVQIDVRPFLKSEDLTLMNVFSSSSAEVQIPRGTSLVAIVDHKCTATHGHGLRGSALSPTISEAVMTPDIVKIQKSPVLDTYAHQWKLPTNLSLGAIERLAEADPCLVLLENDIQFKVAETTLNDTRFTDLTYFESIKATLGYDTFYNGTTGIGTGPEAGAETNANSVIIAIIDNGLDVTHDDLSANIWTNTTDPSNGTDDDGNGCIDDVNGCNFGADPDIASPAHQTASTHGTHVAGLASARANNNLGVAGIIGKNVKIMGVNVFGPSDTGSVSNIINGINYAVAAGAKVINLSVGAATSSTSLQTALTNAVNAGVAVFAAAGNESLNLDGTPYIPAMYAAGLSGMMAVGSFNALPSSGYTASSFTNYSYNLVEIFGPGSYSSTGLLSTIPTDAYGYKQGTSMASPVVAGAAALAIAQIKAMSGTPTPAIIENLLASSAARNGNLVGLVKGCRMLDLNGLATKINDDY